MVSDNLGESMLGTVTMSASKPRPKGAKTRSVEVEKGDDDSGFIVTCRYEQPTGKEGRYIEPSRHVFEDDASMLKFIHGKMGIKMSGKKA